MPALAPNSFIAVTGITGHIGSHVGLAALKAGHRVRGTVRSLERAQTLKDAYVKAGIPDIDSRLELVIVDDLRSLDQYLQALEGVDGVIHIALPLDQMTSHKFVDHAIEITTSLLRAAKQVPSVKRVVVTSSTVALVSPPTFVDHLLTEKDWNYEAIRVVEQDAASGKTDTSPLLIYRAAKTKAEMAAWNFVEQEKPEFDLVSILPDMNYGPILHGSASAGPGAWLESILKGNGSIMQWVPRQWWIDVRDDAKLHVLSLTTPSAAGKRIMAAAAPMGWNQILGIFRKRFPNLKLPEDLPVPQGDIDIQKIDNSTAAEMLGGWIGLEQSLVDFGQSLGY